MLGVVCNNSPEGGFVNQLIEWEDNVLAMLLWSPEHCTDIATFLDPNTLTTRANQAIGKRAVEFVRTRGEPPMLSLNVLLRAELASGPHARDLEESLKRCQDLYPLINQRYTRDQLVDLVTNKQIENAAMAAAALAAAGDAAGAQEAIFKLFQTSSPSEHIGTFLHDTDRGFLEQAGADGEFSSGIQALDDSGIVPGRGQLLLFIAPKKAGKSWFAVNVGYHAVLRGKQVLHVSLENSEALTKRRYIQCWTGAAKRALDEVSYYKIVYDGLSRGEGGKRRNDNVRFELVPPRPVKGLHDLDLDKTFADLGRGPKLLIKEFPTGMLTVPEYSAYLERLARRHDFVPDLVIIDYPDLMRLDPNNQRIDIGNNFRALRGIAVQRQHALVCPTQTTRKADETDRVVTSKDVAEDWSKVMTADIVLTYNRFGEREIQKRFARILVDAARDERDKFFTLITQSYETGQFCVSSAPYTDATQKQVERIISQEAAREHGMKNHVRDGPGQKSAANGGGKVPRQDGTSRSTV